MSESAPPSPAPVPPAPNPPGAVAAARAPALAAILGWGAAAIGGLLLLTAHDLILLRLLPAAERSEPDALRLHAWAYLAAALAGLALAAGAERCAGSAGALAARVGAWLCAGHLLIFLALGLPSLVLFLPYLLLAPALRVLGFGRLSAADPDAGLAPTPAAGPGPLLLLGVGAAYHGFILFSLPPLITGDSWCNLWEPALLEVTPYGYHHTPLYADVVKFFAADPTLLQGFTLIVTLQHLAIVGCALVAERLVRRETGSRAAAAIAGLALVLDNQLALSAQSVLTETLATAL
ncbi:MAG: hypothetical protein HZA54_17990, partial [Planctomycetes bacterium]|nr:hypothetical protein [Planctomycetota bacterium]